MFNYLYGEEGGGGGGESPHDGVHKPQLLKRKEKGCGIEPRSFSLPA